MAEEIEETLKRIFSRGSGTQEDPYRIYNEEQFHAISLAPSAIFVLEENIFLTRPVEPIPKFSGSLYGHHHEVEDLRGGDCWIEENFGLISDIRFVSPVLQGPPEDMHVGLIGLNHHTLGGVQIVQGKISSNCMDETQYLGSIAAANMGLIDLCTFSGSLYSKRARVGGIVGCNFENGRIMNSKTVAILTELTSDHGDAIGGIAAENAGVISDCRSEATLKMNTKEAADIGGIVSLQYYVGFTIRCVSEASLKVSSLRKKSIGGVCGVNRGTILDSIHRGKLPRPRLGPVGLISGAQCDMATFRAGEVSEPTLREIAKKVKDSTQMQQVLVGKQFDRNDSEAPYEEPEEAEFKKDDDNVVRIFS